jgi:Na+-driven multidrug efflux pump
VNSFGTTVVAAWTAVSKFDGLYWVTSNAFGVAVCTFAGQCFGARKYARMRRGVRQWTAAAFLATVALSAALLSCARWGLRLFSTDTDVTATATQMLWCFVPYYVTWVLVEILSNVLRGAGDSIAPMVICLVGVCLLRILWIVLILPYWHTVPGVCYSYPVTWAITAMTFLIYYRHGHWLERCRTHTG